MRQQYDGLISYGACCQDMLQNAHPLSLVWNPRGRLRNRDETTLSPPNSFANRVHGISPMAKADAPAIKAAECTDTTTDRGWGKFRACEVGNVASVGFAARSSLCVSCPEPIDVLSNLRLISL